MHRNHLLQNHQYLKQAEDAVLLDTSDLDFEQSLAAMKKIIAEKVN